MSATSFSVVEFTPAREWTAEDEEIYQTSGLSPFSSDQELWANLSPDEKALMFAYARALKKNVTVPGKLILAVNNIHERHKDFHVGVMPRGLA